MTDFFYCSHDLFDICDFTWYAKFKTKSVIRRMNGYKKSSTFFDISVDKPCATLHTASAP